MFQYILFDLDGTLTDPKVGITTCAQYALRHMGIEETDRKKLEPFIGPPLWDSFQQFYGLSKEQAVEATAKYRERFSTIGLYENEIYPGIEEMLKVLSAKGMKLAVASSKPEVFVEKILEHFRIREYFTAVVGSNLDGSRVEKREVIQEALKRLGVERACVSGTKMDEEISFDLEEKTSIEEISFDLEEKTSIGEISCILEEKNGIEGHVMRRKNLSCAMVGDRKFDVEGARAMNLVSIAVAYGYAQDDELILAKPDYIAETVEELQSILCG